MWSLMQFSEVIHDHYQHLNEYAEKAEEVRAGLTWWRGIYIFPHLGYMLIFHTYISGEYRVGMGQPRCYQNTKDVRFLQEEKVTVC